MQRFNALTATLTLTAGLTITSSALAQSGPQKVPVRPPQDTGTQLGDAATRLDRSIQLVRSGIVRGDQRPDDLETLVGFADAWARAASVDLGPVGTSVVQRQLTRAGTNLLGRSADSVLTLEDLDDFQAAALDAEVERALRRLSRSASDGEWTLSEYASALDAWNARIALERQRAKDSADAAKPQKVRGFGGPWITLGKQRMQQTAGIDQPDVIIDHGGPKYTLGKKRQQQRAGIDQPDVVIDYDRRATGVGLSLVEIAFQESLDYSLERVRGRRGAGLEETFLLVTEFRLKVALQRHRRQAELGENTTSQKIHVFDLALQRKAHMARIQHGQ